MKANKNVILLFLSLFVLVNIKSQTKGTAYADNNETSNFSLEAKEYKLVFPISEEIAKQTYFPKLKNFQNYVEARFIGMDDCGNITVVREDFLRDISMNNLAKSNGSIDKIVEAEDLNSSVLRKLENCGWSSGDVLVELVLIGPDKKGNWMDLSSIQLKMGSEINEKNVEKESQETYEMFTTGPASNNVNSPELASAIEKYMESKWPNEDVTTVNIRFLTYTNTAGSEFKFEGYYITHKKSTGECKYNSCYGKGVKGSNFSITFFNSMNAEKKVTCDIADKLKNR